MKRLALGALGVGLALAVVATPGEAQAVRVGVGINLPRVGVRFEYGPQRVYPFRRVSRYDMRWDRLARLERELYREWLAFEYRRWLRQHRHARFRSQRAWERNFLRDQQRAERAYRKWTRDRERDLVRERERERDRNRVRPQNNRPNRNRPRGR
jgi:hypothetical protein